MGSVGSAVADWIPALHGSEGWVQGEEVCCRGQALGCAGAVPRWGCAQTYTMQCRV